MLTGAAAPMARKMAVQNEAQHANWVNELIMASQTTGYVQANAPQGALTYTSANLGLNQ